jgi:hypothetical protein
MICIGVLYPSFWFSLFVEPVADSSRLPFSNFPLMFPHHVRHPHTMNRTYHFRFVDPALFSVPSNKKYIVNQLKDSFYLLT